MDICVMLAGCTQNIHSCFIWTCQGRQVHPNQPFWSHLQVLCSIVLIKDLIVLWTWYIAVVVLRITIFLIVLAGRQKYFFFDGDHNSSRPQFYYDSVSIFFYNVLHPPQISSSHSCKPEKYYDLEDLKVGAGLDEVISLSYKMFRIVILGPMLSKNPWNNEY